ncbi:MAG: hypothetical protein IME93_03275 [Proteobacteria bacterium]|nr:hypothetical protein [Pseudomonadota bacterium]
MNKAKAYTVFTLDKLGAAVALWMLLMVVLGGCQSIPITPDRNNDVVIIHHPEENRAPEAIKENCNPGAAACVKFNDSTKSTGTMYATLPKHMDDSTAFCYLGHEYLHLLLGSFHPKDNGFTCY